MRRPLLLLAVALGACSLSAGAARTFVLDIATDDAARRTELVEASKRVIDRRLSRLDQTLRGAEHREEGGRVLLTVTTDSPEGITALTEELQEPFSMAFMEETTGTGDGVIVVAGHGSFKATGVTERDIDWTLAEEQPNGKARVELQFTPAGRARMGEVYRANPGKFIGMFVRGKLISKLLADDSGLKDKIAIGDIPSFEFAQTFSDDVNVGRYVTFSVAP